MSTANRILKIIYKKSLTIKQIHKAITDKSNSNVRGRISELTKRELVKRFNGKIEITEKGKEYLDKIELSPVTKTNHNRPSEWEKYVKTHVIYDKGFNYIITKKSKQNIKVWAKTQEQAQVIAKLIYGTGFKVKDIE